MFDPVFIAFVVTPLTLVVLLVGAFTLFAVMKDRDKRLKKELEAELEKEGITRWSGFAKGSELSSLMFDNSYIQDMYLYADHFIVGRAEVGGVIVDFATYPFTKFVGQRLIVDSETNNVLGFSNIDITSAKHKLKLVQLEGNFPQEFRVWYEQDKQNEALTILNPAAMVNLIDYFNKYDIEISNGRVYLYQHADYDNLSMQNQKSIRVEMMRLIDILR